MCNFTNRLFVYTILGLVGHKVFVEGAIAHSKNKQKREDLEGLIDILTPDNDYDLHYDQRQKGEENLRIKLDGFFVGLPAPESSEITMLSDDFLENLGEELLLGLGKSHSTTTALPELYNYNRVDAFHQKALDEVSKSNNIHLEIPAPKKKFEPIDVESKVTKDRKAARSKLKIGQLLGFLLKARKLGSLSILDKKDKY